jgi:hypothetical protein
MKKKFTVGMLVRVKENTHDEMMPNNRIGLIVSCANGQYTNEWNILMSNGKTIKFHDMFLENVSNIKHGSSVKIGDKNE